MTDYRDLTPGEQLEVDKNIEKDQPYNAERVLAGEICAFCYQPPYNCLCGHEDDDE